MIPVFKTHHSIGKSILTEDDIIRLHKESGLSHMVVVEDSFSGFRQLNNKANKEKINLVFGIRFDSKQDKEQEKSSKVIFLAKNLKGIKFLKNIFTQVYCKDDGILYIDWILKKKSNMKNIQVVIPFYDSFLYNNFFFFGLYELNFGNLNVWYFKEDNKHPYDHLIEKRLERFVEDKKDIIKAKSIYYEREEDFKAFQLFKAISNRTGGKQPHFDNPGVNGLSSNKFSFESWKKEKK